MIGHLSGKIIHTDPKYVILDVSGVGYKIYTNTAYLQTTKEKDYSFWTYLAVRENALDLYGFSQKEEIEFFELLLSVSGIGPKSAMAIMSVASLKNLINGIASGDISHLVKVSGLGKKSAEKIVVELKDKVSNFGQETSSSLSQDVDALLALTSLGYGEREVREVLKKIPETEDLTEKIKKAIKLLS